jgi:hypothetical protein
MVANLGLIRHLLLDHLGALAQWCFKLGDFSSLEFPSGYTVCKHDVQFTVRLDTSAKRILKTRRTLTLPNDSGSLK